MEIQTIFAVVCVSDMDRSESWYSRLFGRGPDARPMDGLVQWHSDQGAGLQLVRDADKAGASLVTIVTPTMAVAREQLTAGGLQLEPDVEGDFGIIAQISDPDGNRITLAEPPRGLERTQ